MKKGERRGKKGQIFALKYQFCRVLGRVIVDEGVEVGAVGRVGSPSAKHYRLFLFGFAVGNSGAVIFS